MRRLHFIFLVKHREDVRTREAEYEYVEDMSKFFGQWISEQFDARFEIHCDMMVTGKRSILQRPGVHTLVEDHRMRGEDTYHFYLAYFRPLWTDCTCEGYHAENFGMVWWQRPPGDPDAPSIPFMAEKNCTTVSHVLAHELLRQQGHARYVPAVHDVWTRHFYGNLPFVGYGRDHKRDGASPAFLVIDTEDMA